jgi:hypothetical protein
MITPRLILNILLHPIDVPVRVLNALTLVMLAIALASAWVQLT